MAGTSSDVKSAPLDPDYIKFLLDPDLKFGSYFVVGNAELAPVEKIGVVRKMLAAHSSVFRAQLLDQRWESKEPEEITDILPATFKNLLRFVYGYDTTATMSFEDADDLLYAADRYIMNILKDKLATRLLSLLSYTNICSLLTNPACATVLELHSSMTEILQCETDKVLSTPQFMSCCAETFVKILEQEVMNITELQVWRAAVKWAENKAKNADGKSLRQQLEKPLQHIRVCSLTQDEFCKEVVPTGVLTIEEVGEVCTAIATKRKPHTLTTVCNNMQVRREGDKSEELNVELNGNGRFGLSMQQRFSLQTQTLAVELVTLTCEIWREREFFVAVRIESNQATRTTQTVTYTVQRTGKGLDKIPISTEQRPVVLSANRKYIITLTSDAGLSVYKHESAVKTLEHFTLELPPFRGTYGSPVCGIDYRTLTP